MKRCVAKGKRTPAGWVIYTKAATLLVRPEGLPKQLYNVVLD